MQPACTMPTCTMEDMEFLGVSPPATPEPIDRAEHGRDQEQELEQEQVGEGKKEVSDMVNMQREWPYFTTMVACWRELNLERVRTEHGGLNNCLMYSYLVASGEMKREDQIYGCAYEMQTLHYTCTLSLFARVCARSEGREAAQALRTWVHEKLCDKLTSAKSVEYVTMEKVCSHAHNCTSVVFPGTHAHAHTRMLTASCLRPQAQVMHEEHEMLKMAHVLTLANEKNKHVLVFQDKLKDAYNCCVDVVHYKPGWDHPRKVTRRETRTLVAAGAVPIHLNDPPSHFSALIPLELVSPPRKSPRHESRGTKLPNGTVLVSSP